MKFKIVLTIVNYLQNDLDIVLIALRPLVPNEPGPVVEEAVCDPGLFGGDGGRRGGHRRHVHRTNGHPGGLLGVGQI